MGMAALAPTIQSEYGISLAQMGVVLAAPSFGLVPTLLPWGLLADRFGERAVIAVGLSGTAGALAATAFSGSFAGLVLGLAGAGALGGCVQSASGRAVMRWFEPGERGLALGIRQTAVPAGGAVAAGVLPALADGPGLKASFGFLAAWSAVAALAGALVLRERSGDDLEASLGKPLRDGALWLLCGGGLLYVAGQMAIVGFVVLFLHEERGVSPGGAAAVLASMQVLGGAARIAAGRWSDRLAARVVPLRRVGVALGVSLVAAGLLAGAPTALLVPALLVAGTLGLAWNGLSYTAAAERAGRARSGAAIGIQQTALAVGGTATPIAFAALVGATSWGLGFAVAGLCPLAGWVVLAPLDERR